VNASMTGNLFELTFDGQTAILGRQRKADPGPLGPANAWVGQNPDTLAKHGVVRTRDDIRLTDGGRRWSGGGIRRSA